MKKFLNILVIILFIFTLVACDDNTDDNKTITHKVTYYNYEKLYYEEIVEDGQLATKPANPTASSDEYTFLEWQLDGKEFSFNTKITKNIELHAAYTQNEKVVQLFDDLSFSNGFGLKGVSTNDGSKVFRHLTTDNADCDYVWQMGQWWTKYDLKDAEYEYVDGVHIYKNESHEIKINTAKKSLYTKLLGSKEYDKPRVNGENWPHILIEQSNKKVPIAGAKKVIASLDFNIIRCDNMMSEEEYNAGTHAAQYLWYLTLTNYIPTDSDPEKVGTNGDFFWFGIPIYDNRSPKGVEEYKMIDQGFVGATNKLIYGMSSREYLSELPLQFGKTYHIEIDILPYLITAYIYGISNGALKNTKWENMYLGYMNFGWELPGTFDVESEVSNISVKVYY